VELALIAPVMVLLVFGVLDLARGYRMQIQLESAAREGASVAQMFPGRVDCPDAREDVVDRVHTEELGGERDLDTRVFLIGDDGTDIPITGCTSDLAEPGDRVRVQVSTDFRILTPVVASVVGESIELTGGALVRVQGKVQEDEEEVTP
jgi:TadE-like protein